MKINKENKTIYTLKQPKFNIKSAEKNINIKFKEFNKVSNQLNKIAEKTGIYLNIDETREKEKILKKMYPFLYNTRFKHTYDMSTNLNNIEKEYKNRIQTALNEICFVKLNEKTKIITCKEEYGHIKLYPLVHIADFENDLYNLETTTTIIKKFKNGNVDFKFNSENDFLMFEELVYYSNELTQYIINNVPDEVIVEYKEKKKAKVLFINRGVKYGKTKMPTM